MHRPLLSAHKLAVACVVALALATLPALTSLSQAATPTTLDLRVLLVSSGSADPTSQAWQNALSSEGVATTVVTASGSYGAETVTLPSLSSGSTGLFNGVVVADAPAAFGRASSMRSTPTRRPSGFARSTATRTRPPRSGSATSRAARSTTPPPS